MSRRSRGVVLVDEYAAHDSEAMVALVLHVASKQSAARWLDAKLTQLRENPDELLTWMQVCLLRGLSSLGDPGPEHGKQTGRQAGGGTLTKGS